MLKVMNGVRPDRPPSGLSDTLWGLLVATWVVQHAQEPGGRPSACTVLGRLKECVDDWGKSIVPIVPESWQDEDGGYRMFPRKMPQLIHAPSAAIAADNGVTVVGNTAASDFLRPG